MLGYHVHEKAILLSIVPLALRAASSLHCARIFQRLSVIGHFSLLPLIHTHNEFLLKVSPLMYRISHACTNCSGACLVLPLHCQQYAELVVVQ